MERKLVTIEEVVDIQPIGGADSIDRARVRDWWVVVKKGEFKVGDLVCYFEIDSFLPDKEEYAFLKKGSTLKRMTVDNEIKTGIRLKTIKLRGQISQGLIMPLSIIPSEALSQYAVSDLIGIDVSVALGVIKYEPPIPAQLAGVAKGFFPGFIHKTDEERIQNMGEVLTGFYVTEKIDGSSVTFFKKDGVFGVCSRNLELKEEGGGTQWKIARELDLENKIPDNFALQGELVGEGIQDNPLKVTGQTVYFFNAYNIATGEYLDFENFKLIITGQGLKTVPVIEENFSLPSTVEAMLAYAEGKSLINPIVEREGVVVRPKTEMQLRGQRLSFKAISNKYLLNEEN